MSGSVTANAAYKNEFLYTKPEEEENMTKVDWTDLPDYPKFEVFSLLNSRDRASLASVCKSWRAFASLSYLWVSLDIRQHKLTAEAATSLAGRCRDLKRLKFSGVDSANAIIHLQATNLNDLMGDLCKDLTDATLSMLAAEHKALESLELGPEHCVKITSHAIGVVASCCPMLKRLRLSGIQNVDKEAIGALVKCCPNLRELALWDCMYIDESALGKAVSLNFLSVAGCTNIKWSTVAQVWSKMPYLVALDVSRTDVTRAALSGLLKSQSLRVVSAFECPILETGSFVKYNSSEKILLIRLIDVLKGLHQPNHLNFLTQIPTSDVERFKIFNIGNLKRGNTHLIDLKEWLEWLLSHALIWVLCGTYGHVWVERSVPILLSLLKSSDEDVRERAAAGVSICADKGDRNVVESVVYGSGIRLLLKLARHHSFEGVQSAATRAIANLCVIDDIAQVVATEEVIGMVVGLARSPNRLLAGEAAFALWNISATNEHIDAIVAAGGVKPLIDLMFKWRSVWQIFLEGATGALANLAKNDKCREEVGVAGVIDVVVLIANSCRDLGVQKGTACCLANLASYGDINIVWRIVEAGAVPALVHLCSSSLSELARFVATVALAFIFDGRIEKAAKYGMVFEGTIQYKEIKDCSRHMALENIEAYIHGRTGSHHNAASSFNPAALEIIAETVRIEIAETISWNDGAVSRFVTMAESNSLVLGAFAAFALLQLTMPGAKGSMHHAAYLQKAGAGDVLRAIAAATNTPLRTKVFCRIVLRNIEYVS